LDREHVRQKRAFLLAWRECVERRAFLDSSFEACCDLRRAYAPKLGWCAWRTAAEAARKKAQKEAARIRKQQQEEEAARKKKVEVLFLESQQDYV
jgi:hypothetical protein